MSWIVEFFRSAMGKKAVMAVTGVMLFGFVLVHMIGNLKLYFGPEKINAYAEGLRELGAPVLSHGDALWIARLGLLAAVGLHIYSAVSLTLVNRRARTQGYARKSPQAATYASRTMRYGGLLILAFVIYHLMHFTWGNVHGDFVPGDVYHNVVSGFQNPLISGFYILTQLALGLHLYHGLWSMLQTLGLSGPRLNGIRKPFAAAFATIIVIGNVSLPLSVLAGFVTLGG
jgi:succinate dehydrogenase / fumarate reductase cytochrome b subunit